MESNTKKWQAFAPWIIGLSGKRPLVKGWTEWRGSVEQMGAWERAGHNFGMLAAAFPAIDIDVTDAGLAAIARGTALELAGPAPARCRGNSPKCLLMYAPRHGEELRKRRIEFTDAAGQPHAIELLATGQQYAVAGTHPSGAPYYWTRYPDMNLLTALSAASWERYAAEVCARLAAAGCTVTKRGDGSPLRNERTKADAANHAAPGGAAQAIDALRSWNAPAALAHDAFIELLCAFRGACGDDADESFGAFAECLPGERGEEDGTRYRYFSCGDTQLGWSRLAEITGFSRLEAAPPVDEDALGDETPDEAAMTEMRRRYVWAETEECFVDLDTGGMLNRRQFDIANPYVAQVGLSGPKAAHNIFLNDKGGTRVKEVTYHPGKPTMFDGKVNRWRPSRLKPFEGSAALWTDLARTLFGAEAERMLDYLAFVVQNPGVKPAFSPVIVGGQGIGKDTFLLPFCEAIGMDNVQTIGPEALTASFNPWVENQVVIVNEVHTYRRGETMDMLKPYLAAPPQFLTVNQKFQKAFQIPNVLVVIMMTNHMDALAPEHDDRRLWVIKSEAPPMSDAMAHALRSWYAGAGCGVILNFLLTRDVSGFNALGRAPATEAKQEMIELTRSPSDDWMAGLFDEGAILHGRTTFSAYDIPPRPHGFNNAAIPRVCKSMGYAATAKKYRDPDAQTVGKLWTNAPARSDEMILAALRRERA